MTHPVCARLAILFLLIGATAAVATLPAGGPAATAAAPGGDIVRAVVSNHTPIIIPDRGPANAYPSTIQVNGLAGGRIVGVHLRLMRFSHTAPDDVDIVLVAPNGKSVVVLSDAGGSNDIIDVTLVLNDQASSRLPDRAQLRTGRYKPSNYLTGDSYPRPARQPTAAAFKAFDGLRANGKWKLYVVDDRAGNRGTIGAWQLHFQVQGTRCDGPC